MISDYFVVDLFMFLDGMNSKGIVFFYILSALLEAIFRGTNSEMRSRVHLYKK